MSHLPDSSELLTIQKAAHILGVSIETLRRWDRSGRLPSHRTKGGQRRYTLNQVLAFRRKKRKQDSLFTPPAEVVQSQELSPKQQQDEPITQDKPVYKTFDGAVFRDIVPKRVDQDISKNNEIYDEGAEIAANVESDSSSNTQEDSQVTKRSFFGPKNPTNINNTYTNTSESSKQEVYRSRVFVASLGGFVVVLLATVLTFGNGVGRSAVSQMTSLLSDDQESSESQTDGQVLQAQSTELEKLFAVHIPAVFERAVGFQESVEFESDISVLGEAEFLGTVSIPDGDLSLGTGTLTAGTVNAGAVVADTVTASNVLNTLTAGDGIGITDGQSPTVSNTGVLSLQGQTGALSLTAGSGIAIDGLTISSTVTGGSSANAFGTIVVAGETDVIADSTSDSLTFVAGTNIALTTSGNTLTIASSGTNSQWTTSGSSIYYTSGNVGIGTTAPQSTFDLRGNLTVQGDPGGSALTVLNYTGTDQNILTASSGGVTRFTVGNDGTLIVPTYAGQNAVLYADPVSGALATSTTASTGLCLISGGSTPSWGACGGGLAGSMFQAYNGAVVPVNTTLDFLLGSTATDSAKFAVLNMTEGTPVASVSSVTSGNAISLSGDGQIQSVRNRNLTIGGNSTGSILFAPNNTTSVIFAGSGNVGIGTTAPSTALDVNGVITATGGNSTNWNSAFSWGDHSLEGYVTTSDDTVSGTELDGVFSTTGILVRTGAGTYSTITDSSANWDTAFGWGNHATQGYLTDLSGFDTDDLTEGTTNLYSQWDNATGGINFAGGNVGIGTTAPTASLDVVGSASTSGTLTFRGTTDPKINVLNGESFGIRTSPGGDAGLTERFTVLPNGNVGIGSTSPGTLLDVNGVITATGGNSTQWNQAFSWGDHAAEGYLTSYTETDPVFTASDAFGISSTDIGNWDDAFSWGDHSLEGYVTTSDDTVSGTELDGVFSTTGILVRTGAGTYSTITDSSANWDTAFGWGDHSLEGYLTDLSGFDTDDLTEGTTNLYSQWDNATGGINFAGGNVGIGTTAPTASLDVVGSASLSGTLTFRGTTNPEINLLNGENLNIQTSVGGDAGLTSRLFVNGNTGNIGIGTTAPLATMHLNVSSPLIRMQNTTGTPRTYTLNTNTSGEFIIRDVQGGDNNILQVDTSGNVGINTTNGNVGIGLTNPATSLQVQGGLSGGNAAVIVNQTNSNDIFTASASGTTRFVIANNGNVGIGTSLPSTALDVTGVITATGGNSTNWNSAFSWGDHSLEGYVTTSDDTVSGTELDGVFSTTGILVRTGAGTYSTITDSSANWDTAFGWGNHATQGYLTDLSGFDTDDLTEGTTNLYSQWDNATGGINFAGGNVGIGTTAPLSALDIAGSASLSGTLTFRGTTNPEINLLNGENLNIQTSVGGDAGLTSRLFVNGNTGNIGIGTTDPIFAALQVSGNISSSAYHLGNVNTLYSSDANVILRATTAKYIAFHSNNTEAMRLDDSGNLGIGTTAPVGKLDVTGDAGGVALVSLNELGTNDIFTASSGGTTRFTVGNDGTLTIPAYAGQNAILFANPTTGIIGTATTGSSNLCLLSGGSTPSWGSCAGSGTDSPFNSTGGTIVQNITTEDFLLGGTSTDSAKFAVLNIADGVPVASLSATSTNNSIYLSGDGQIQTVRNRNLTIGGDTTGSILFAPNSTTSVVFTGSGNVGIGTTAPSTALDVTGVITATGGNSTNWNSAFSWGDHSLEGYVTTSDDTVSGTELDGVFSTTGILVRTGAGTYSTITDSSSNWDTAFGWGNHATQGYLTDLSGFDTDDLTEGTTNLYSQWDNATGGINFAGGNVGIGTTAPLSALDIAGSASLSGTLTFRGSTNPEINLLNGENLNIQTSVGGDAGLTSRLFVNGNTGNIGIGTTAPSEKLSIIDGQIYLGHTGLSQFESGRIRFAEEDDTYLGGYIHYDGQNNVFNLGIHNTQDQIVGNDSNIISINRNSGNTGIGGDITPDNLFTVGTTSQFQVNSSGAIAAATGIVSSGNIDLSSLSAGGLVQADATTGRLSIATAGTDYENPLTFTNGLTRATNTISLGGTLTGATDIDLDGNDFTLSGSGNVGIGTVSPLHKLNVEGASVGKALVSLNETGAGNDIFTASASGTTRFVIRNDGNVGIGTTSPSTALDVNGVITATGGNSTNWNSAFSWGDHSLEGYVTTSDDTVSGTELDGVFSTTGILVRTGAGTYSTITDSSSNWDTAFGWGNHATQGYLTDLSGFDTDDLTEGTTNLYSQWDNATGGINFAGGNVGIGTTAPQGRLNVTGDAGGVALVTLNETGTSDIFTASVSGQTRFTIQNNGTAMFSDGTNYSGIRYSASTGGLGVVDGSGTEKLRLLTGSAPGIVVGGLGAANVPVLRNVTNGTTGPFFPTAYTFAISTNSTERIRFDASGNIGIGNTNPTNPLDVTGTSINGRALVLFDQLNASADIFTASASGTTRFVIRNDGNVGIGTTAPSTALDVNGVITATGGNSTNWNSAFSWGDHALEGYVTTSDDTVSGTELDGVFSTTGILVRTGAGTYSTITDSSSNWDTAFGWGNHATQGYLTDLSGFDTDDLTEGTTNLYSQWDNATGGINFAGGNVGIGTTTPGSAFDVVGNVNVSGYATMSASLAVGYSSVTSGVGNAVFSGNVGIGSTNANSSAYNAAGLVLSHNSINFNSGVSYGPAMSITANTLSFEGDSTEGFHSQIIGSGQSLRFLTYNNGLTEAIRIAYNGNVGIGTTSPLGKLNVEGAAVGKALTILNETGDQDIFTASSSGTTRFTIANNGNITAGGTISGLTGISSSGNIDLSSLSAGGLVQADATTGRLSIATAGTDFENPLTFTNGLTRATDTVSLGGTLTGATDIALGGNDFYFSGSGNVGIGTTSPTNRLQVLDLVGFDATTSATFLGYRAGYGNSAVGSTFVGYEAGFRNTNADGSTALGYRALRANTTGDYNTAVGNEALVTNSTGYENTALGYHALTGNTIGRWNVALGAFALRANTYGDSNLAFGNYAMYTNVSGGENIAIGESSLYDNESGNRNVAVGHYALSNTIDGDNNVAVGYSALNGVTTGNYNTALGFTAGSSVQTGSYNVFLGYQAGYNETGSNKLYVANSNTSNPLIYGDFAASSLGINTNAGGNAALTVRQVNSSGDILSASSSGTTRFVINNAGNVGIGTTNPTQEFQVVGTSLLTLGATDKLQIDATTTDSTITTGVFDIDVDTSADAAEIMNFTFNAVDDSEADTITGIYAKGFAYDDLDTIYVSNFEFSAQNSAIANAYIQQLSNINTANNLHPTAFLFIEDNENSGTGADGILFDINDSTAMTDAIDASDPQIVNALSIGANNILGSSLIAQGDGVVGIGTTSPLGKLNVEGAAVGKALTILNETGDQDIFTASSSGTTRFTIANNGNITAGGTISGLTGISSSGNIDLSSLSAGGLVQADATTGRLSIATAGTDFENPLTFTNGLTRATDTVSLGGTLTGATDIALGGNDFYFSGSGNVGIGTTAPLAKLDISGSASLSGTLTFRGSTNPEINLLNGESLNIRSSVGGDAGLVSRLFIDGNSGNVGIGDSSPDFPLTIQNADSRIRLIDSDDTDSRTDIWSFLGGSNETIFQVDPHTIDSSVNSQVRFFRSTNTTGSVMMEIFAGNGTTTKNAQIGGNTNTYFATYTGNVGIGTSSPIGKLNVEGAAVGKALTILNETGNQDIFTASSSGTTRFVINNAGNVGIGTTAPNNLFEVIGTAPDTSNGTLADIGATLSSTSNNQNGLRSEVTVDVSGAASNTYTGLLGTVSSYDDTTNLDSATLIGLRGYAYIGGDGDYGSVQGGNYTVELNSAGTISNAFGLQINDATLSGGGGINQLYGAAIYGQTNGTNHNVTALIGNSSGATNNINLLLGQTSLPTGNWSLYNGSSYNNYFAGNVGLGTTAPLHRLHVEGASVGKALVSLNETGAGNDIFTASSSGTTRFVINNAGNVGIGTTNPSSFTLQVAGNIGPDADDTYDLGASSSARFRDLYLGPSSLHVQCLQTDGCGQDLDYSIGVNTATNGLEFGVNDTTGLTLSEGGNVGIGTTTPEGVLQVNAASQTALQITSTGGINVGDAYQGASDGSYEVSTTEYSESTLTGGATSLVLGDDETSSAITLPFTFTYYGQDYTDIYVGSNTVIQFGTSAVMFGNASSTFPNSVFNSRILGYVGDADPSAGGTIQYEVLGSAPNRVFVLEYDTVPVYGEANTITQQIKLYETTNNIEIHTSSATQTTGTNVVQGIVSQDGSYYHYLEGRNGTNYTLTSDAVRFSYNGDNYDPGAGGLQVENDAFVSGLLRVNTLKQSSSSGVLAVQSLQDEAVLGNNLVSNGDFSNGTTDWTFGTNWSHDAGNNEADHTSGNTATLSQDVTILDGSLYKVQYTVKNRTTGNLRATVGGVMINFTNSTSNTTYTNYVTAETTDGIEFTPESGFDGSVDDVIIQKYNSVTPTLGLLRSDGSTGIEMRAGGLSSYNSFIGLYSGQNNILSGADGKYNSSLGAHALKSNTIGSYNTAIGSLALENNTLSDYNTAIGYNALNADGGDENTAVGAYALWKNLGQNNTALGYAALQNNELGNENIGIGYLNSTNASSAFGNTSVGAYSMFSNYTGSENVSVGYFSLSGEVGSENVSLGYYSLTSLGRDRNSITAYAASATSGYTTITSAGHGLSNGDDIAIWDTSVNIDGVASSYYDSEYYSVSNVTTDTFDINKRFVGAPSAFNRGYWALKSESSGNTAIGYASGDSLSTGSYNTLVGYQAGDNLTTGLRNIIIGSNIDASSATVSDQLNIGNLIYGNMAASSLGVNTNSIGNAGFVVNQPKGAGDIFSASSSATTRFVISNAGNVGIGTTNPSSFMLQVAGHIGPNADDTYDLGASSSARFRDLYLGPSSLHIQCLTGDSCGQNLDYSLGVNSTTNSFEFGVNDAAKLVMTEGGNVGIGTTAPAAGSNLDVAGNLFTDFLNLTIGPDEPRILFNAYDNGSNIVYESSNNDAFQIFQNTNTSNLEISAAGLGTAGNTVSFTQAIVIGNDGNVGIGAGGADEALEVDGNILLGDNSGSNIQWRIFTQTDKSATNPCDTGSSGTSDLLCFDSDDDAGTTEMYISASGNIELDSQGWSDGWNSTSSNPDIAEHIRVTDPSIGAGDIVSATNPDSTGLGKEDVLAKRTSSGYEREIIGIVSTNPSFLITADLEMGEGVSIVEGGGSLDVYEDYRPLAIAGRIATKVSTVNGPIQAGDPITSSDIPGFGMVSSKPGQIVGKALQNFDGSNTEGEAIPCPTGTPAGVACGKIIVMLNVSWYDPYVFFMEEGNLSIAQNEEGMYKLKDQSNQIFENKAAFSEALIADLTAGRMTVSDVEITETLTYNGKSIDDHIRDIIGDEMISSQSAYVDTSELEASHASQSAQITDIQTRLSDVEILAMDTASTAAFLENIVSSPLYGASGSGEFDFNSLIGSIDVETATVSGTLTVLDRAVFTDVGVTGVLTAGLLNINSDEASINTVGEPLRLQSDGFFGVDILAGKVTIDPDGNIETLGTITADTVEANTVKAEKLEIGEVASAADEDATGSAVLSTSIGEGVIETGETEITIDTTAVGENSQIFITPKTILTVPIAVTDQVAGESFTVEIPSTQIQDVRFSWWIVN